MSIALEPHAILAIAGIVSGATWVFVFKPAVQEIALVSLWGTCIALAILAKGPA